MMTTDSSLATTDNPAGKWQTWLVRWDAQQEVYIEQRERVYAIMFDVLGQLAPANMRVLDLAAGPGAISKRLLDRFDQARVVAVDVDPVLLAIGQGALGDMNGRLTWCRADLRDPSWVNQALAAVDTDTFDVVVSSTATHWLLPAELTDVYAGVVELLGEHGVFLNADGMPQRHTTSRIAEAVRAVHQQRQDAALAAGEGEAWADWWNALREEPELAAAFTERDQVFPAGSRSHRTSPSIQFQQTAMYEAGFTEVGSVYQDLTKHLVVALR